MAELASRAKFNELIEVLQKAGDTWVVPGPGMDDSDVAEGFRNLTHILQSALYSHQEFDPERPVFNRIVSPTRSFTGDNTDALYFETPIEPGPRIRRDGQPRRRRLHVVHDGVGRGGRRVGHQDVRRAAR